MAPPCSVQPGVVQHFQTLLSYSWLLSVALFPPAIPVCCCVTLSGSASALVGPSTICLIFASLKLFTLTPHVAYDFFVMPLTGLLPTALSHLFLRHLPSPLHPPRPLSILFSFCLHLLRVVAHSLSYLRVVELRPPGSLLHHFPPCPSVDATAVSPFTLLWILLSFAHLRLCARLAPGCPPSAITPPSSLFITLCFPALLFGVFLSLTVGFALSSFWRLPWPCHLFCRCLDKSCISNLSGTCQAPACLTFCEFALTWLYILGLVTSS